MNQFILTAVSDALMSKTGQTWKRDFVSHTDLPEQVKVSKKTVRVSAAAANTSGLYSGGGKFSGRTNHASGSGDLMEESGLDGCQSGKLGGGKIFLALFCSSCSTFWINSL